MKKAFTLLFEYVTIWVIYGAILFFVHDFLKIISSF